MPSFQGSPVAFLIFIITIAFSLYSLYSKPELLDRYSLAPYYILRGKRRIGILTSGFLHADLGHLLFNMLSFYFFAFQLEIIIGSVNFFIIYLCSLILSDLPSLFKHRDNYAYRSLGASGAISAVLFSFILFYPKSKIMVFPLPIPIPAWFYAILFLAYSYYAAKRSDGINHSAHLWGALAGLILTIFLIPEALSSFLKNF